MQLTLNSIPVAGNNEAIVPVTDKRLQSNSILQENRVVW